MAARLSEGGQQELASLTDERSEEEVPRAPTLPNAVGTLVHERALYWEGTDGSFYYQRLKGDERGQAGSHQRVPYQYWYDGSRTQWIYDGTGLLQVLGREDRRTLQAGVYPLGVPGKAIAVAERVLESLASAGVRWTRPLEGEMLIAAPASTILYGLPLSFVPSGKEILEIEWHTVRATSLETDVTIRAVSDDSRLLEDWRFTIDPVGDQRAVAHQAMSEPENHVSGVERIVFNRTEWPHGKTHERPLTLPPTWSLLDTRVSRRIVMRRDARELPPDEELYEEQAVLGLNTVTTGSRQGESDAEGAEMLPSPESNAGEEVPALPALIGIFVSALLVVAATRKRHWVVGALGLLMAVVCTWVAVRAGGSSDSPDTGPSARFGDLVVDASVIQLGDLAPGATGTSSVRITNSGHHEQLLNHVVRTCGCVKAVLGSSAIAPGESAELQIEVHNAKGGGRRSFGVKLLMTGTDNSSTIVPLVVRAYMRHGLRLEGTAASLWFSGDKLTRGAVLAELRLTSDTGPLPATPTATVWPNWMSVRVLPVAHDATAYRVQVVSAVDIAPICVAPTAVTVNLGDHTIQASLLVEVAGSIRCTTPFFRSPVRPGQVEVPVPELQFEKCHTVALSQSQVPGLRASVGAIMEAEGALVAKDVHVNSVSGDVHRLTLAFDATDRSDAPLRAEVYALCYDPTGTTASTGDDE